MSDVLRLASFLFGMTGCWLMILPVTERHTTTTIVMACVGSFSLGLMFGLESCFQMLRRILRTINTHPTAKGSDKWRVRN